MIAGTIITTLCLSASLIAFGYSLCRLVENNLDNKEFKKEQERIIKGKYSNISKARQDRMNKRLARYERRKKNN